MDEKQLQEVEALRSMYLTEGWAVLLEQLSKELSQIDSIANLTSVEELMFARGQYLVLTQIINHQDNLEAFVDALENPDEGYNSEPKGY